MNYLLVIVALIYVFFAMLVDIKKREVPDWLSYSLIMLGFGVRGIYSLYKLDYWIFLYGIIGGLVGFGIGMLMYYTRQWGGGDSKLMIGLGVIFGTYLEINFLSPYLGMPFLLILIVNILFFGGIYTVVYSIILMIKNYDLIRKNINKKYFKMFLVIFTIFTFANILFYFFNWFLFINFFIIFGSLMFLVIFIYLAKIIEKFVFVKKITVNKLVEGDILYEDVVLDGRIICKKGGLGLEKGDILLLKKNVKEVIVKDGIPFVPGFFIGLIFSLFYGNLFNFLF